MIDTIKLLSPPLTRALRNEIFPELHQQMRRDNATGDIIREKTSNKLIGPFGVSVHVEVVNAMDPSERPAPTRSRNAYTQSEPAVRPPALETRVPALVTRTPALFIEASVHKLMLGHNITGGPMNFGSSCLWLIDCVSDLLGVVLPAAEEWRVERVDWAENFFLPGRDIPNFFSGLKVAHVPRRKTIYYDLESITFKGDTTLKLYHKLPAVQEHDRKRLERFMPSGASKLLSLAEHIVRCEVSLSLDKLVRDFAAKPYIAQVNSNYLATTYDTEVARLFYDPDTTLPVVRRELDVEERLYANRSPQVAGALFALWRRLALRGEAHILKTMSHSTYYRQRKELIVLGCAWLGTDAAGLPSSIRPGFSLKRSCPYHDYMIAPTVLANELARNPEQYFMVADNAECMHQHYLRHWIHQCRQTVCRQSH